MIDGHIDGSGRAERDAERDGKGPRGWVVLTITGVIVAAIVGGGIAINRFVLDADDEAPGVDAVPATVDDVIDVEPIATSATRLFTRTTESGIEVRVNESDDDIWGMGPGFGMEDVPDWCIASSTVSVTALTPDAIGMTQMPRSKTAPPDPAIAVGVGGIIEEAPLVLVVAQVDDTVTRARLSHPSGVSDSMEPIDGLVVLAVSVPMPDDANRDDNGVNGPMFDPWGGITSNLALEVLHRDGGSDRFTQNDIMNGIPMWTDPECTGSFEGETAPEMTVPELKLPKGGAEQPADPVADEALIEQAFLALYADIGDKETLFRYVDDPSGLDLTMVGIIREYSDAYESMEPEILDMVFFSPIEASFVYTTGLDPWQDGFTALMQSFGRARLVNDTWLITRSTVCQDIMKVGIQCTI